MANHMKSAFTEQRDTVAAGADLMRQFEGVDPKVIAFFCAHQHDGSKLSAALRQRYPNAEVVGCTTSGGFTADKFAVQSVSAIALGAGVVRSAAAGLAKFEGGVEAGVNRALARMGEALRVDLRKADPKRYVGVTLVEGLKGKEEAANDALGNAAPQLSFVGGSAGDNLEFKQTRVFHNGEVSDDGAALLLLEAAVPFTVCKTCSFEPMSKAFKVTRADVPNRIVHELDGKPVAKVYAEVVGTSAEKLDSTTFMSHPMGLMINGTPWIRSPMQLLPGGALKFYCNMDQGMDVHVMRSTNLVGDTQRAMDKARAELGGQAGGLLFNCILRRLELDARQEHGPFLKAFSGMPAAGFHTYGESWLGHINQTLTALLFANP